SSATGSYLVDLPMFQDVEDASGNRYRCDYTTYDSLGQPTRADAYTGCGTSANGFMPSGQISVTAGYDAFGNPVSADDADALAGSSAHVGCSVGGSTFSRCTAYDGTFGTLPTSTANALNQQAVTGHQAPASRTATRGL